MYSLYSFFGGVTHANIAASEANNGIAADTGCEAPRPRAPQIEMPAIFVLESGDKWYIGADEDGSALMRFDTPADTHITVEVLSGGYAFKYQMPNWTRWRRRWRRSTPRTPRARRLTRA